ncbi:MAG TPA: hypothetical protein DDY49_01535 [Paenibacillaceae bacterium]|nr:hypothetical protein [Paenibacillaceae bacterium]
MAGCSEYYLAVEFYLINDFHLSPEKAQELIQNSTFPQRLLGDPDSTVTLDPRIWAERILQENNCKP